MGDIVCIARGPRSCDDQHFPCGAGRHLRRRRDDVGRYRRVIPGTVDETDGAVTFSTLPDVKDYGVVGEIASRVLRSGGRVLGVRKADIPGGKSLAAILHYAM